MVEFLSLDKYKLTRATSIKASPRLSSARKKKPLIARKISSKKSDTSTGRKSGDSKKLSSRSLAKSATQAVDTVKMKDPHYLASIHHLINQNSKSAQYLDDHSDSALKEPAPPEMLEMVDEAQELPPDPKIKIFGRTPAT